MERFNPIKQKRSLIESANALLMGSIFTCSSSFALADSSTLLFDIDKQPLSSALKAYAEQANTQLMFSPEALKGLISPAISGRYTRQDALRELVEHLGLEFVFKGSDTVVIRLGKPAKTAVKEPTRDPEPWPTSYSIEEIEITARKRRQFAQDVGIAMTTFTGEAVKDLGLDQPIDLAAQTPGMFIKNGIGVANPYITVRGVGQSIFVTNTAQPVGMYVNEINLPYISLMSFPLYDLERIEILKGPQGTLFGRNTTAGALSLFTAKPSQEFEAEITAGIGRDNLVELEGFINGSLTDSLAARLAFKTENRDGWYKNQRTGNDFAEVEVWGSRISLHWDPSFPLTSTFTLEAVKDRSGNVAWKSYGYADPKVAATMAGVNWSNANAFGRNEAYGSHLGGADLTACNPSTPGVTRGQIESLNLNGSCTTNLGYSGDNNLRKGSYSIEPIHHVDNYSATLNTNYDFENTAFTSVTGYIYSDRELTEEFDGTVIIGADQTYRSITEVFSQEFRLASLNNQRIDWLAGTYYSTDKIDTSDTYDYSDAWFHKKRVDFQQETENLALFGQTEWHIDDKLSLITGARYTRGKITHDGGTFRTDILDPDFNDFGFGTPLIAGQITQTPADSDTITAREWTGKVGLDYKPNDDWLIYAFISRGFKSGGYNGMWTLSDEALIPYDTESLIDYELGFKSNLRHNTVQFNGGLFFYDYKDIQSFILDSNGNFIVDNIPEVQIFGAELELWWRPVSGLDIRAGVSYNDIAIKDSTIEQKANDIKEGNVTANSSEWMFNGLINYKWPITQTLVMSTQVDFSYQDDTYLTIQNHEAEKADDYWLTNIRATLSPANGAWELSLWVKNVADKEYITEAFPDPVESVISYNPGVPRTYGASFTYRWL